MAVAKVLVVRFSSMGDIVLCSPVLRCLREQLPSAEIHVLTKTSFAYLLEPNPNVDKLWTIDRSVTECLSHLKEENYDVIIDLHNNIRTQRLKKALRKPAHTLKKMNVKKWLLVNLGVDLLPKRHVVDRYMDTVAPLGVKNDGKGLDFFYPEGFQVRPELHTDQKFVVLVVGGSYDGKRLPKKKWGDMLLRCSIPFVVVGGEEDKALGEDLAERFPNVSNLAGHLSVFESAKVVEQSTLVISNDTGMMHIAAAFRKPVISLWGQTTPRFGMYPYMADKRSLAVEPDGKRPLSKLGNKKTSVHAMDKLSTDKVVEHLQTIWVTTP